MIRLALAQINPTVGALQANAGKILEFIGRARQLGANLIVFPELALTGYPPEDLLLKKQFIADNQKALGAVVKGCDHITAVVGFVDKDAQGRLYNAAAVIHNKMIKGVYHKIALPNYGVFDEKRYFTPGADNKIFTLGKTVFGVSICEDIWVEESPCREQASSGAGLLINISASPYHAGKARDRENFLKAKAKKYNAVIAYVNLIGGQDELVFDGASLVVNFKGQLAVCGKSFEEDLIVVDMKKPARAKPPKPKLKNLMLSRELYTEGKIPIAGRKSERLKGAEEIYKALVLGARDYLLKNGFKKAVIGLSGGIDSSLVGLIACDAVGKDNVIGVSMPSKYTSLATRLDARTLAGNLGVTFKEFEINNIVNSFLKAFESEFAGLPSNIAEENLQARIRGNILMALSNKFGWLVLTTGNKSEIAMGYCTLYGDMAGGFSVIKDIPKTKVYELARFRNGLGESKLIPESIFERAPTAELKENQKDQDTLPPYEVLDDILSQYVEKDKSLVSIGKKKYASGLIRQVTAMVDRMEYKRRQAPPGIKITPKAFGRDRRFPITNGYREK